MLKSLNLFKIIDSFIISGYEYIYDDHSRIIEEKNLGDSTNLCYTYDNFGRIH